MITSPQNSKVKLVRRLLKEKRVRNREQLFVTEGTRWLRDLVQSNHQPRFLFVTEAWQKQPESVSLLEKTEVPIIEIEPKLLAQVGDTSTNAGILAVVPFPKLPIPATPTNILIVDAVTNPGNLGTLLRTAAAAGTDMVLLAPGCVDPYNPKVIRGGMGAHLRLLFRQLSWDKIRQVVGGNAGMSTYLADSSGNRSYTTVNWQPPFALIVGNEANGLSDQARQLTSKEIHIPMHAQTESLNAAIAAGIILFEAARQRSK